jgi:mannose-6-phosphate isomerase-like protein (cupin superfamily)
MSTPESFDPRLSGRVLAPAGSGLVLAEWTAEGRPDPDRPPIHQAPLHSHGEDEAFYVLEGALGVRIGDKDVEVPAGGAAIVPSGAAHTYWNPLPQPTRYLLVMGAETYALIQALHTEEVAWGSDAMRELFRAHGATFLG